MAELQGSAKIAGERERETLSEVEEMRYLSNDFADSLYANL